MGPPSFPASSYKPNRNLPLRSRSPSISRGAQSIRNGTSSMAQPRNSTSGSLRPTIELSSPRTKGSHTRRSSVTSFASELDERFNIAQADMYPEDMPPTTDPRMIQAITQTMIGEHLWKYTRKAGRSSEISGTRHRRFFWIHPYTRTLYWSEHDPSTAGAKQMKAKSVAIEAVRVITDSNAYPPGLHRKSLVVVTPGRELVFTAPTQARHETWFNALSYLLLRTGLEREEDMNDTLNPLTSEMTREDVEEFNPQIRGAGTNGRSVSRTTGRTRMSLSSYNSRTTGRTMSPVRRDYVVDVPTLTKKDGQRTVTKRPSSNLRTPDPPFARSESQASQNRDTGNWSGSIRNGFGSLASRFRSPAGSIRGINGNGRSSFSSSMRSKSALSNRRPGEGTIYDASIVTEEEDSEDDLRVAQIERERQEREQDELENVRACCGGTILPDFCLMYMLLTTKTGKHDVGSLSRGTGRHSHSHAHGSTSTTGNPFGSIMSRHHSYGTSSHRTPASTAASGTATPSHAHPSPAPANGTAPGPAQSQ